MNEQLENLLVGLADAGCTQEEIGRAEKLLQASRFEELTRHLRRCRCSLVEEMHKSQQRVDCMDLLIRQAKKIIEK